MIGPSDTTVDGSADEGPADDPPLSYAGADDPIAVADANSVETLSVGRAVAPLRALLDPTPADDILVLSFTANLGFLSRAVAGRARARGARVSVISDPSRTSFDAELVRGAGVDWLDGRAWRDGAFHPKLVVAASDSHATVCVGSGNATPAGWVTNAELWIRFDAIPQHTPAAVVEIGTWLAGLEKAAAAGAINLGPGAAQAITAAAKRLSSYPITNRLSAYGPASEARVVSNLTAPILEGLPTGPVDELIVTSPYLDPVCEALGRVCERLQPARLTVCVKDDFRYNGRALKQITSTWNGTVVNIDDVRSHHGKLLEWVIGEHRQALIGSPNITRAGLLRTLGDADSNCELAVICGITTTLCPPFGDSLSAEVLDDHPYRPPTSTYSPMLVGAVISADGTELTLARAATVDLVVEAYDGTVWKPTGHTIPAGTSRDNILGWHPHAGCPLRVRPVSGGEASTPYPATDPHRLVPRQLPRSQLPGTSNAFPDDPMFLERLRDALARIRVAWNTQTGIGTTRRTHHRGTTGGGDIPENPGTNPSSPKPTIAYPSTDPEPSWATTTFGRLHGEAGAAFSEFVLPELFRRDGGWQPPTAKPKLDPDPPDDPDAAQDAADAARHRRERRIADLRRWCTRQLDPDTQSPQLKQLRQASAGTCTLADVCLASVVAAADALAAWDDPEEERITVTRALRPLSWPPDSSDLAGSAASAAAVGVWILHRLADESEYPVTARAHVRTIAATLSDCLDSLDDRGLADRCATLATLERSTPPSSQEVFNLVLEAVSPDPIADLVAHFVEDEPTATGRVITLHATLPGDGVVEILAAWHLVEVAAPVAIIAQTATDGRVIVAWVAPHLVLAHERPLRRGFVHELKSGLGVVAATENHRPPGYTVREEWYGTGPVPPTADAVIAACGVSLD